MVGKEGIILVLYNKIFVIYKDFLISLDLDLEVYSFHIAQIVFLKIDKAFICIYFEYTDFVDVLSKNLAVKLLEHSKTNNDAINLVKD